MPGPDEPIRDWQGAFCHLRSDDVVFEAGRYQVKGVPVKALTLEQIAPKACAEGLPEGIEYGLEATEPAIVNAVVDELKHLGVRHLDMPLRAECVWRALYQETKR